MEPQQDGRFARKQTTKQGLNTAPHNNNNNNNKYNNNNNNNNNLYLNNTFMSNQRYYVEIARPAGVHPSHCVRLSVLSCMSLCLSDRYHL